MDEFLQNGGKKVKNTLLLHDRIPPDQDLSFNTKASSCGFSTIAHGEKQTTMLQCLLYTKSMRMYVRKERSLQLCSMPYIEMTRLNLSTRLPLERREVNEIKEALSTRCLCVYLTKSDAVKHASTIKNLTGEIFLCAYSAKKVCNTWRKLSVGITVFLSLTVA